MDTKHVPSEFLAELPAELESAVAARRLLVEAVGKWALSEGVGSDGSLAISELVTNAVLHAGTVVGVRVRRLGEGVRIEVCDGSPRIPVVEAARPEDLLANRSMTGRGLALVAAMSDRWGAEPYGNGKLVWAEVGTGRRFAAAQPDPAFPPAASPVALSAEARAAGVVTHTSLTGGGRRVHLVGVPVEVLLESARQLADLQREIQVMAMARGAPPELEQVIQAGRPWISDAGLWADDRRVAESAAARGAETVDLDLYVTDDVTQRLEGLASWLRRVGTSIAQRQLLTLPASPAVSAYRRWREDEIRRQVAGRAPRPCPVRARA